MKKIHGQCHCGNVQYMAECDEHDVILCHCNDCQTISGAPFRAVIPVKAEYLNLRGKLKNYIKTAANGNQRIQAFCPECGTHIYATSAVVSEHKIFNIRLGTVAQRDELTPSIEIWCQSAQQWPGNLSHTKKYANQP